MRYMAIPKNENWFIFRINLLIEKIAEARGVSGTGLWGALEAGPFGGSINGHEKADTGEGLYGMLLFRQALVNQSIMDLLLNIIEKSRTCE